MRKLSLALAGALMGLVSATDVAAKDSLYDCSILKTSAKLNWIAKKIGFVVRENGQVQVVDEHILHFMDTPQSARVRKSGDVLRIGWNLTDITSDTGSTLPVMKYRANLNVKKQSVKIYVTSSAFTGAKMNGTGTCRILTGMPKIEGL